MEKKRYGFENEARRTILAPERELQSLPGYKVRARKFTIAAQDELSAAQERKRLALPATLRAFAIEAEARGKRFEEALSELTPEKAAELLAEIPSEASSSSELMRLSILYGLGEHNLDDGSTMSSDVALELVEKIMEFPALAEEIHAFIREWNAPLPKATPVK